MAALDFSHRAAVLDFSERAKPPKKRSLGEDVTGFMANIDRGLGLGDEASAVFNAISDVVAGKDRVNVPLAAMSALSHFAGDPGMARRFAKSAGTDEAFQRGMAQQRAAEDSYTSAHPIAANLARGTGMAVTAAVPLGPAAAAPNAMIAAGRGALAGAAGGAAYGLADRGDMAERLHAADTGAAAGAVLGAGIGAGGNAMSRIASRPQRAPSQAMAAHARQDPGAMRERANAMMEAGFERPALVDVVDDAGRGVIRATASRNTPARSEVRDFAEGRALNLPDRIGMQARRHLSDDPRSPDQIRTELTERRSNLATQEYAAPYAEPVEINMGMARQLQGDPGRAAMQRARQGAEARNDEAQMVEIDRLLDGDFFTPVTAGTLHRIQVAMGERAERAAVRGARDIGGGLAARAEGLRSGLEDVPGLNEAHATYRDLSRQIEAADVGEQFMARNTDEFSAQTQGMTPDQLSVARATARRAVERQAGENVSAAPGVARRIATAPEQQRRNAMLLGDDAAGALENSMATEARAVVNASDINPRTGSQTQLRGQDAQRLAEGAQDAMAVGSAVAGHPAPLVARALGRLRTLGISDAEAVAISRIAIDPNRLDEAIRALEPRVGREEAVQIVQQLRLASGAGTAAGALPSQRAR